MFAISLTALDGRVALMREGNAPDKLALFPRRDIAEWLAGLILHEFAVRDACVVELAPEGATYH